MPEVLTEALSPRTTALEWVPLTPATLTPQATPTSTWTPLSAPGFTAGATTEPPEPTGGRSRSRGGQPGEAAAAQEGTSCSLKTPT